MKQQDSTNSSLAQYVQHLLQQDRQELQSLDGAKSHAPIVARRFLRKLFQQTEKGKQTYGRYLFPWNGRNQVTDLSDEIVDAFVYLTMLEAEHQYLLDILRRIFVDAEPVESVYVSLPTGLVEALAKPQGVTRDTENT